MLLVLLNWLQSQVVQLLVMFVNLMVILVDLLQL